VNERLYVGAITGTSIDGLDLALVETSQPPKIVAGRTVPFPALLAQLLKGLAIGAVNGVDSFGEADHRLGDFIAHAISEFLTDLSLAPDRINAIGSHAQTVRHRPDGATPFSIQLGDPNLIEEITGIDAVADFRRRDIAAGGQGAPLVPPFHEAIFRTTTENRAVLNIGGIANVGAWARTGRVDHELLSRLLADPYFDRPAPKSTGKELFNLTWIAYRTSMGLTGSDSAVTGARAPLVLGAFYPGAAS